MSVRELVAIGIDVGGTATRVLAVDHRGHRRGEGCAGGGNPVAYPKEMWSESISRALGQALIESGPVEVGSVVVGVAGDCALADGAVAVTFEQIIRNQVGRDCPIRLTGDVVIAFTAGTPEPDGTILISGTGATAVAIRDRLPVRQADGHGWLLGDAGSGLWIGREAVRAALAELEGRGRATRLRSLIVEALLGRDAAPTDARTTCHEVVQAVHGHPAVNLSKLAPVVSRCAKEGDQVAQGIAREAVDHLMSTVEAVRSFSETTPIVVTGGVAEGSHVIAALLREALQARWPTCIHPVRSGVAGAAWLALKGLQHNDQKKLVDLHHIVVRSVSS